MTDAGVAQKGCREEKEKIMAILKIARMGDEVLKREATEILSGLPAAEATAAK